MPVGSQTVQMEVGSGHLDCHQLGVHEGTLPQHVRVGDAEPPLQLRLGQLRLPYQGRLHLRGRPGDCVEREGACGNKQKSHMSWAECSSESWAEFSFELGTSSVT